MHRIFIIEDDPVTSQQMRKHLEQWGYSVSIAEDFRDIMPELLRFDPHLVLLDISLPFFNGYHWCEEIRKRSTMPIIYVSSTADNMNIVLAVSMGGDDFIAKPFDLTVLTAKIQAMLRRSYSFQNDSNILEYSGVILDLSAAVLMYKGEKIPLTRNDFQILKLLMENAGRIVSRDEIMTRLWEDESFIDDNTLTVNVTRLRKKLSSAGLSDFIITKKGMGYGALKGN